MSHGWRKLISPPAGGFGLLRPANALRGLARTALALPLLALALLLSPIAASEVRAQGILAVMGWPDHLPYPGSHRPPLQRLGELFVRPEVAFAFIEMARDARADGVSLIIRSAHRSQRHQSRLFYGGAQRRGITLERRAQVSAPPGFSEHHTGYAIDLDDARDPQLLQQSFERTRAGQWLMKNAYRYCFELSFPPGNSQGISYEPWHWRFIGSDDAMHTFAAARAQYPAFPAARILPGVRGANGTPRCEREQPSEAPVLTASACPGADCPEMPGQLASADLLPEDLEPAKRIHRRLWKPRTR